MITNCDSKLDYIVSFNFKIRRNEIYEFMIKLISGPKIAHYDVNNWEYN